jgi:hypothetical protein
MLPPVELFPTSANLMALKVLAFLSALSNPAAVNLLVLPPTICRASPKNHLTVSVFIICGLILSPFIMQEIEILFCAPAATTGYRTKFHWQKSCTLLSNSSSPACRAISSI